MIFKKNLTLIFIFVIINSFATNYYIDSTNGNDNKKGITIKEAWKSIEKVNNFEFQSGDSVLFKRGKIFRGNLVPVSGSIIGSVTYSAYGRGTKPKIFGSIQKKSTSDWISDGGNIWHTLKQKIITKRDEIIDVGNIIFNNEAFCGIKVKKESDLNAQGKFWFDINNLTLKMYSVSNPATYYSNIEISFTQYIVNETNKSYITYQNLDLRYGGAHGIGGGNTNHINIKDVDMSYIGGGFLPGYGDGTVRFGNGVEFWGMANNNIVERCTFNQIYDAALTVQGDDVSGYETYNIYFRNNIIKNCEYSYELWGRGPNSYLHDIYFENNTCLNAGFGWSHSQRPDPNGTHLITWGFSAKSKNVFIRNNIFYESSNWDSRYDELSELSKVNCDYNCWYKSSGPISKIGNSYFDFKTQWSEYKSSSGQDAHSIAADPLLKSDFNLSKNSPCVGAGIVSVKVKEDYNRKSRLNKKIDIGAFSNIK